MGWYLNPTLTRFRAEVNARWPHRDKTSDGTIGDAAHRNTKSDHNPDPDGSVDAWDMDVDGVNVWECIRAAIRHESIQYIIYNRKITSRTWGLGKWRTYKGSNPHTKHVHFNTRPSHERSTKPWLGEIDMRLSDKVRLFANYGDVKYSNPTTTVEGVLASTNYYVLQTRNSLTARVTRIEQKIEALAEKLTKPTPVVIDISDPAVLDALAKAVADELHSRLSD
ncbi:hypothetical protein QTQ03_02140 [Micromonospora sp. WMMA1363]|uniref:hypothetical protein n=1 Tax=Micromonospora sp. WMMA1363 TaxID=3053985 RepID=UPI00259CACFC|nr:hypothetical protein [Micromonospora sp. WMMA1363]MDM4718449.1 hypothetical protein [Micromonospora sp. WMMA1363]